LVANRSEEERSSSDFSVHDIEDGEMLLCHLEERLGWATIERLEMAEKKKRATPLKQHGEKGVFVGGDWVSIEECDKKFNISGGSGECTKNCETCPRSRSRQCSAKKDGSYDVVIIGGG
jgi:hypothetical protein